MSTHSSATTREHTPHETQTTRTNTIINALKRRAEAVLNDKSIDAQSRAVIRYALETNDPWLARLVRQADAGEAIVDETGFLLASDASDDYSNEDKVEALAEVICRAGDEAGAKSAALLVLMATLEYSTNPKTLANLAKHIAFTRCGELNLSAMVDAQVAAFAGELLVRNTLLADSFE